MPCSAKAAVGRSFHDSGRTVPDLNQETTPKKKNERIGSNLWLLQSSGHQFFCFTAHEQMIGRSIFFRGAICCCVLDSGCIGGFLLEIRLGLCRVLVLFLLVKNKSEHVGSGDVGVGVYGLVKSDPFCFLQWKF
jgi:hypothetical protein